MMGIASRPDAKLFYTDINIAERIPAGHFLRQVEKIVDFSFVRAQVAHLYGRRGHESVDPAVVLKLMFLLFYENVASERSLMEQLAWRLDWLWFCGYDLDSQIPDHSIISKARRRWGPEVFQSFFANILDQCMAAGLVDGRTVHVDSSLIEASADRQRLQPALRVCGQQLYQQLEEQAQTPAVEQPTPPVQESAPANQPAQEPLPPLPTAPICPSDPDARLTRKYGESVLGYKDHRSVDDRCGIITSTSTTDAATADPAMLMPVLDQHQFNVGRQVREVAADKAYGTGENYRCLRGRHVRPCIPHERYPDRPGKFPRTAFQYDAQQDCFICPAGQRLGRWSREPGQQRTRYRAKRGVCAGCPLKRQCSDSKSGRLLSRYDLQEHIDWADKQGPPAWRRRLMRHRKIRAEGSFADAANNHGYKRARWRGLWKVRIQNLMVATVQNLRKLIRARHPRTLRAGNSAIQALLAALYALLAAFRPLQTSLASGEGEL